MTGPRDQEGERNIERLVSELGRHIEKAMPEKREEIRQMAVSLMDEEMRRLGSKTQQEKANAIKRPLNPIALSGFVLVLGVGLTFALPPVGLILIGAGMMGVILGGLTSLIRK